MKKILSLDFGTKTGYCLGDGTTTPIVGTWNLAAPKDVTAWRKSRRDRTRDPRILRLYDLLRARPFSEAELLVFEDVQFSVFSQATQIWAGLRTVAWLSYPDNVPYECVGVSTLKKFATGHGGATKEMMREALARQHPVLYSAVATGADDTVDAIWIWWWARQNLGRLTA